VLLILPSFLQSLHEKKMADNEKKFEARLDQQKSDISAQVTRICGYCVSGGESEMLRLLLTHIPIHSCSLQTWL
jgi:hypothetical protein